MSPNTEYEFDTLIIVCCHAIWLGGSTKGENESEWLLASFQKGESPTFIEHIEAGIAHLAANDKAILVFSGGPTKPSQTMLSEGESYLNLAEAKKFFKYKASTKESPTVHSRVFADSFATDSYQNVLFPLLQFHRFVSHIPQVNALHQPRFPRHVTLVSHAFKRQRFLELHLPALKWPMVGDTIRYVGINPPFNKAELEFVLEAERRNGYRPWTEDFYGTRSELGRKRLDRGWSTEKLASLQKLVSVGLKDGEIETVTSLLEWNGGETGTEEFPDKLPWE